MPRVKYSLINRPLKSIWVRIALSTLLFIAVISVYSVTSANRHRANPDDRMVPSLTQIKEGIVSTLELPDSEDPSIWDIRLIRDVKASLIRLVIAVTISVLLAVFIGLYTASFGVLDSLNMPFIRSFSFIPPIALLPLIFVWLGRYPELAKITIIFFGTFFVLVSDVYMRVKKVPQKLIDKGYTLGASTIEVLHKIMLRYSLPGIVESIRLAMTPAWIFLIAAEFSLPSTEGLGYYMNVVRRQLGVNIIIWYIFVIVILGIIFDIILKVTNRKFNAWYFNK